MNGSPVIRIISNPFFARPTFVFTPDFDYFFRVEGNTKRKAPRTVTELSDALSFFCSAWVALLDPRFEQRNRRYFSACRKNTSESELIRA